METPQNSRTEVYFSSVLIGGPDGDSGAKLPVEGIGTVTDTRWAPHNPDELMVCVSIDRSTLPREYLYSTHTSVWCYPDEWTS